MVAHEVSHVVLDHRIDSQYALFDRLLFDEKDTFKHFGFSPRSRGEAANTKATSCSRTRPTRTNSPRRALPQSLQTRRRHPELIARTWLIASPSI